jgi:NADH dehydrogenase
VHAEGARKVVDACTRAGVARLVHMSAINADPAGAEPTCARKARRRRSSRRPASRGRSSAVVMFGAEDAFLNLFAKLLRLFPALALAGTGREVRAGPLSATSRSASPTALDDDATIGQRYKPVRPRTSTRSSSSSASWASRPAARRPILRLGPALSSLQARLLELVPGTPMTRDNLASMQRDAVCDGPFPPVFGIAPVRRSRPRRRRG